MRPIVRPAACPPVRELEPPLFLFDVTVVSLATEPGEEVGVMVTVLTWPLVTVSTDAIGVGVQVDEETVDDGLVEKVVEEELDVEDGAAAAVD